MSVCAKFQLSSWSRSAWKVCVWRFHGLYVRFHGLYAFQVTSKSNPTKLLLSCCELSWVELSYVGFWQYHAYSILLNKTNLGLKNLNWKVKIEVVLPPGNNVIVSCHLTVKNCNTNAYAITRHFSLDNPFLSPQTLYVKIMIINVIPLSSMFLIYKHHAWWILEVSIQTDRSLDQNKSNRAQNPHCHFCFIPGVASVVSKMPSRLVLAINEALHKCYT